MRQVENRYLGNGWEDSLLTIPYSFLTLLFVSLSLFLILQHLTS